MLDAVIVVCPEADAARALIFITSTGMSSVITSLPASQAQPITPARRTRPRGVQHLQRRTCQRPSLHHLWTKGLRLSRVRYHMPNRARHRPNVTKDLRYQG